MERWRGGEVERWRGGEHSLAERSGWNEMQMRTSVEVRGGAGGGWRPKKFVWPCMLETGCDIQKKVNGTKGLEEFVCNV